MKNFDGLQLLIKKNQLLSPKNSHFTSKLKMSKFCQIHKNSQFLKANWTLPISILTLPFCVRSPRRPTQKKLSMIGQAVWPQFAILYTRRPWRFFDFLNISGMEHSRWKMLTAFNYSLKNSAFEPKKFPLLIKIENVKILPDWQKQSNFEGKLNLADFYFDLAILCKTTKFSVKFCLKSTSVLELMFCFWFEIKDGDWEQHLRFSWKKCRYGAIYSIMNSKIGL